MPFLRYLKLVVTDGLRRPHLPLGAVLSDEISRSLSGNWALCVVDGEDDVVDLLPSPSIELQSLVFSALRFPVVLATANEDLQRQALSCSIKTASSGSEDELNAFEEAFRRAVESRLKDEQLHRSVFCLAKGGCSFAYTGQWYWIIAYERDSDCVMWIDDNRAIYQDPRDAFEIEKSDLESLPSRQDLLRAT